MRRSLCCILCVVCLFLIFQMPATAEEIAGFPVIDETGPDTGKVFDWKILPKEEKETGFIEGFAVDGGHRCAILVNDKIMVYDETTCTFKCQFKTAGSCLLSFWNGDLIMYDVRSEYFFKFNFDTSELKEYRLDDTRVWGDIVDEALDLNPGDPNTKNGFYVTNHLGNRTFKIGYDMLIYVKDGKPQTVYSSYAKIFYWIVFAIVNIIVALAFLRLYVEKKKQKQNEGENQE